MGTKERREREKEKRYQDIIDSAENVFFEKGFDSATMDDIASNAELSKGAVYRYFNSKSELCLAIVNRALTIVYENLKGILLLNVSGLRKIGIVGERIVDFSYSHQKYYCSLMAYRQHISGCADGVRVISEVDDVNMNITSLLRTILQSAKDDCSISTEINVDKNAHLLWGSDGGLFLGVNLIPLSESTTCPYSREDLFFEIIKHYCKGVSK